MSDAIMIDLETFGPAPGGAIVSIGAVAFNYEGGEQGRFYVNVEGGGRVIDERTMRWWLQQGKAAQEALFDPKPEPLSEALKGLSKFILERKPKHVWANGVSFDLVLLRDAWKGYPPWSYKQEMCMRPLRVLGERLGVQWGTFQTSDASVAHNAVDDAYEQAMYVCEVMRRAAK